MGLKFEIKFPCGYELKVEAKGYGACVDIDDFEECPLHGKDCPNKGKDNKPKGDKK